MIDKLLIQLAQSLSAGTGTDQVNIPNVKASDILHNALNTTYFIAGTVAVIVIIVGGITFATSSGNSANVTKAKNMILYAVVGLVVIMGAFLITNFVIGAFK
jgi:hypothetical protein